jgi:hypothetical protein
MTRELLTDRNEIIDKVNSIATQADRRNWQGIIDCFADEVLLDYASLAGGLRQTLEYEMQLLRTGTTTH